MLFVNRRARKSNKRGSSHGNFHPRCEGLEAKILLAIDLGGTSPTANPIIATAPFGMDFGAGNIANTTTASLRAGAGVADLGDVNGDGYEDFAIAAPGTSAGLNSYVTVIFGSNTVGSAAITNWIGTTGTPPVFNYTANDRVGDLSTLGAAVQNNPITGTALQFPFAGVTFVASINTQAGMSAVAGVNVGGRQGLLIGAPGALDANGANPGTGRVYFVFGNFNGAIGQTVDLDTPTATTALNFLTFTSTATGGQLGTSVAGGFNIFADGSADVILGAPAATVDGQINAGAVYVVSTAILNTTAQNQTLDVTTLGQGGSQSLILAGAASGDRAGFSVADGGSVDGATAGGNAIGSLLIGAPQASGSAGVAYLVYGGSGLANLATTTSGVRFINLARVGTTGSTAVPGAIIVGAGGTNFLGQAVSTAGDFNNDGFRDILLGAPGFDGGSTLIDQGAAYLLYGAALTSSTALTGTISLANPPTGLPLALLAGARAGDLAGSSVSPVGFINTGQPNSILIGAPGVNSSAGSAYLIPGRAGLNGAFSLANAETTPLSGIQFLLSTPSSPAGTPNLFGSSVSGRLQTTTFTADTDNRGDFIIGAPGYDITQNVTRFNAGGAQIVQGGLITVPIPPSNTITTQIGVGTPFAPFSINATTPANLQIFVFGSTTTNPDFMPVTDIDPTTVVVNGVAFPNATIQQDPDTNNYLNGIPDAIITISPRGALNLPNGVTTVTISGQTLSTSPLAGFTWTGTATVTVTGGSVTPIVNGLAGTPRGPNLITNFISPFGANQYTPSLAELSAFNYQPIPTSVALAQFLPPQGFRQRIYTYNHPGKTVGPYLTDRGQRTGRHGRAQGVTTLSSKVFNRSRFHAQKNYNWTHKPPKIGIIKGVIPTQSFRRHFGDNLIH